VDVRPVRSSGDLLVLAYAAASQVEVQIWHPAAGPAPRAVLLAGVLALLLRRRFPRAAPTACAVGGVAAHALLGAGSGTGVGVVTAAVAAGLLGAQGRSGIAGLVVVVVVTLARTLFQGTQASDVITGPALLLTVAAVSAGVSRTRRRVAVLRAEVEDAEARGRLEETSVLTAERRRVARELHDVASHHLTVAALQASAARLQLGLDRGVAVQALAAAEQAGRAALGDLRPLLDLLGADGGAGLAPQPGLAQLPGLLRQVRAAGLDVRLTVEGELPLLPPGQDLVAFRVVQEALTNALRHGNGSASLHLSHGGGPRDADRLQITVDNPVDLRAAVPHPGGHGLVGLHERLALYGGALQAGRRGNGFRLQALLPTSAPVEASA
jgi:signal transduction histidine kinase